jgi:hypothetical protein
LLVDGKTEKRRETYEVTGLGGATGEDENGLWARAGATRFEFGAGGGLAGFELAGLESVDLCALRGGNGGSDGQAGEEGGSEELHCWWLLGMDEVQNY